MDGEKNGKNQEQEYDFYAMGICYVNEHLKTLKQKAKLIERMYGTNARLEFESGIANSIPVYETWPEPNIDMSEIDRGGIKNIRI